MKVFQEQWYQIIKQQEEELSQFRETYHNKQHKTMIDSSVNVMKVSHQLFRIQEESLKEMSEYLEQKSNMLTSEHFRNEVPTVASGNPYSEYHFERNFQANISPSDQSL